SRSTRPPSRNARAASHTISPARFPPPAPRAAFFRADSATSHAQTTPRRCPPDDSARPDHIEQNPILEPAKNPTPIIRLLLKVILEPRATQRRDRTLAIALVHDHVDVLRVAPVPRVSRQRQRPRQQKRHPRFFDRVDAGHEHPPLVVRDQRPPFHIGRCFGGTRDTRMIRHIFDSGHDVSRDCVPQTNHPRTRSRNGGRGFTPRQSLDPRHHRPPITPSPRTARPIGRTSASTRYHFPLPNCGMLRL